MRAGKSEANKSRRSQIRDISETKKREDEIRKQKEELEEKTGELETRNAEMKRLNDLAIGRELKMVELKKRISELEKRK